MNSLLLAVGLSSCLSFAEWTGYYYQLRTRSVVSIPKTWMLDGIPEFEPIIDHAYTYPEGMTTALVELEARDYCRKMVK